MATTKISLPKKTWTLVSEVSVRFQIPTQISGYAVESVSAPTDLSIKNKISPGEIYSFQKLDGDLYMYSNSKNEVAIEPLQ